MMASRLPKCLAKALAVDSPAWRIPRPNKNRGRVVFLDAIKASIIFCADFSAIRSKLASFCISR